MEKVCSSKRDAAFTSSPPPEFVIYDHSKTPMLFPVDSVEKEGGFSANYAFICMWNAIRSYLGTSIS